MMRNKDKLAKSLCDIIDQLGESSSMSVGDVELAHHAISALFKLNMMDEEGYPSEQGGSYYDGGNSYGHYVRGHYSRDGGYSRDGDGGSYDGYSNRRYSRSNGDTREKLERIMREADGKDREAIQRVLDQMR